jgi:hypothetical protein
VQHPTGLAGFGAVGAQHDRLATAAAIDRLSDVRDLEIVIALRASGGADAYPDDECDRR